MHRITVPKTSKYHAQRTVIDGIGFASKKEARRYSSLKLLERAGEISDLKLQVRYPIVVNGNLICTYVADFVYMERGSDVVEDAKGMKTDIYKLKKKLMKVINNIDIRET